MLNGLTMPDMTRKNTQKMRQTATLGDEILVIVNFSGISEAGAGWES